MAINDTDAAKLAKRICDRFPSVGNLTLAKILIKEHPRVFADVEKARRAVRYYRGASGARNRNKVTDKTRFSQGLRKPPPLPKSFEEPWARVKLDCKRLAVLSDIHIPYHDTPALTAALDFIERWKCDCILLNGDIVDFYGISRFSKDPSRPSVKEELAAMRAFLEHLTKRFGVPIFYKLGNHEERYEKYIWESCPEIHELASNLWRRECGADELTTVIDNQAIVLAGKLPILHGHELPKGIASPVNPARGAWLRTSDPILCGHYHRQSEHTDRSMLGKDVAAWSTGCLCGLSPAYARINKWTHGFATVEIDRGGDYHCQPRRIVAGKVF